MYIYTVMICFHLKNLRLLSMSEHRRITCSNPFIIPRARWHNWEILRTWFQMDFGPDLLKQRDFRRKIIESGNYSRKM